MLRAAIVFFVLALIAVIFGATGFAGLSMEIGKILLGVFLIMGVIAFVLSLTTGKRPTLPH
jgi:uncharacterized membrane protein YtjA (UPF0391 family)